MGTRLHPDVVEKVLVSYAETNSGARTAHKLGLPDYTVYKILREYPTEFENYRRMVRMRAVDRAWAPLIKASERLTLLLETCDDISTVLRAVEKLYRILGYTAGYSADNQALSNAAKRPVEMSQTNNVMDARAIAEGIKAAKQLDDLERSKGNGNRISALGG